MRLLGSMAGREGPAADPQKQGSCPLSPDGAQQGRSCLWNYHGPEPGNAVIALRWSPCSVLKSLAHPRVRSVPLLPSPPTAEQPHEAPGRGHQLRCMGRKVCAKTGRHTTHTGMVDSTAPGAHVGTLRDGDTVIPNTHTHPTHTQMHMGLNGHTQTHTHQQPTLRQPGWGQLCSPYGAQIQPGCPRIWLWGWARASVPGEGSAASVCSPPSRDTYHTPVRSCPPTEPKTCTGPTGPELPALLLPATSPEAAGAAGEPGH